MEGTPAPGESLAVLRRARGLGRAELARLTGLPSSYLRRIEDGTRPVTHPVLATVTRDGPRGGAPIAPRRLPRRSPGAVSSRGSRTSVCCRAVQGVRRQRRCWGRLFRAGPPRSLAGP
ncbi:helix-turn-helix domain-containing protein [Streptomyces sp. NPDC094437]|uniref:helix-turn-helix domain-containing protein n=1 Tax=Streptomyces sp. NPDC094437 TaxID=3366060 RepID=UPI003809CAD8